MKERSSVVQTGWTSMVANATTLQCCLCVTDRSCESLLSLTCSITQMADLVQIIHREKTPVCVESIVEVVHRSWEVFVRPTSSKASKGAESHTGAGLILYTTVCRGGKEQCNPQLCKCYFVGHSLPGNCHQQQNKEGEEGVEESGRDPGCNTTPTVCIARPSHRQEPHTGW